MESSPGSPAGYVRLFNYITQDNAIKKNYMPSGSMMMQFLKLDVLENVDIHGPAFTLQRHPGDPNLPEDLQVQQVLADEDYVIAFECQFWPKEAKSFQTRMRKSGWPTSEMIVAIVTKGCHVVPVPYSKSSRKNNIFEWRISFSVAERILARSLNLYQRKCFLIVKSFHQAHTRQPHVLATYHLKTVFFWLCERISRAHWNKYTLALRVNDFLDEIINCLILLNIPNYYFISENNLIGHLSKTMARESLKVFSAIRSNPVPFIESFIIYNRGNKYAFLRFKPICQELKIKMDRNETNPCFVEFFANMTAACIHQRDIQGGLSHIRECLDDSYLSSSSNEMNNKFLMVTKWLANIAVDSTLDQALQCHKMLINIYNTIKKTDDDLGTIYCNLACLMHVHLVQQRELLASEQKRALNMEIEQFFQLSIQHYSKGNTYARCSFANYLLQERRFREAIDILEFVNPNKQNVTLDQLKPYMLSSTNSFSNCESQSVDAIISKQIEEHGEITIPSLIFCCYILINCFCHLKKFTSAAKTLKLMNTINTEVAADYRQICFILLQKSKSLIENAEILNVDQKS